MVVVEFYNVCAIAQPEYCGDAMTKIIMVVVTGRLFRDGIRRVLEQENRHVVTDYELLSQVSEDVIKSVEPDLFVIGVGDRDSSTELFSCIRGIRAAVPKARWILLSRRDDEAFLREAADSEIDGFLLEDSPEEVLRLMAELVLLGHYCIPTALSSVLRISQPSKMGAGFDDPGETSIRNSTRSGERIQRNTDQQSWTGSDSRLFMKVAHQKNPILDKHVLASDAHRRRAMTLSDREREIMNCLVGGHSNKIIARDLGISEATVKVHVKALLRKLQVSNRTQAAICAISLLNDPLTIKDVTLPTAITPANGVLSSLVDAND